MKVSIITPSYNNELYIRRNIESVLSQTWDDVEHIVVDGGSTDGTIGILNSYSHLRWISEPDRGMYDAINKGIRMSSGEIISYLNVDDRYFEHTVQAVVEVFSANPDVDFLYGYCEYIDENDRKLFTMRPLPYKWAKCSLGLLWCQPSWFWRKSVHDRVGLFDATLRYVGDAEFMRRLVVRGLRGMLVKAKLAKFRLRSDCLTIKGKDSYERERLAIREQYQVDKWSVGRIVAEALFAIQNIRSYKHRIKFRRLRYSSNG